MTTVTKGEATAERILDAAFKSIAARGCGAVTLRGIAVEAGVVLSQLNYYYGNKDSLFAAVMKRMQERYTEALDKRLHICHSAEEQIVALIEYNEYVLIESPDTYRNFLEFRERVAAFISDISAMIERRIARYEPESKVLDAFSVAAVTRFILSASFGIALQHLLDTQNQDVRAGFAIMKAAAKALIQTESKPLSKQE
jgi:AcrR family transcriptional regulator